MKPWRRTWTRQSSWPGKMKAKAVAWEASKASYAWTQPPELFCGRLINEFMCMAMIGQGHRGSGGMRTGGHAPSGAMNSSQTRSTVAWVPSSDAISINPCDHGHLIMYVFQVCGTSVIVYKGISLNVVLYMECKRLLLLVVVVVVCFNNVKHHGLSGLSGMAKYHSHEVSQDKAYKDYFRTTTRRHLGISLF
jgi:hypothetical protein